MTIERLLKRPCCKLRSGLVLTIADGNCSLSIRSKAFPIVEQRLMDLLYVDTQSLAPFPLYIGMTVAIISRQIERCLELEIIER